MGMFTGMLWHELGDIVGAAMNDDPAVLLVIMLLDLDAIKLFARRLSPSFVIHLAGGESLPLGGCGFFGKVEGKGEDLACDVYTIQTREEGERAIDTSKTENPRYKEIQEIYEIKGTERTRPQESDLLEPVIVMDWQASTLSTRPSG